MRRVCLLTTTPRAPRQHGFDGDFLITELPMPAAEKQDRGHSSYQKQ